MRLAPVRVFSCKHPLIHVLRLCTHKLSKDEGSNSPESFIGKNQGKTNHFSLGSGV